MDNTLYDYSPIVRRPKLELPDGARVAVWVGVNVEHYVFGRPALSLAQFTAELVPDPTNYGWRDYGPRVGLWRLARILEQHGFPLSAITNSEVLEQYPEIVEEGNRRGWTWVAHGINNSTWHVGMERDDEVALVRGIVERFEQAVGTRPKGWLGPALTSTMNTTAVLAELGFTYTLDWAVDDQPFDMNVPSGRLLSVPYSSEVNDIPLNHLHHASGPELRDAIIDQFEVLYEEGAETARVLGIGLHPFLAGQPFRAKYVAEALAHIASHEGVWKTTSDEIADWYLKAAPR
jgi:peptidoglycan/xylan/chitin deacetylase (PgdA/CDA1 family)